MANINNADKYAIVTGTVGNDNIYNTGAYSTIIAAEGNDTIDNLTIGVKIYAGDGDDSISNKGVTKITVEAGAGDDLITNRHSSYTLLRGDTGNDYFNLIGGNYITVEGGDGSDTIVAASSKSSIHAGDGDDIIYLTGSANTVIGGTGNDTMIGSRYTDTFLYADGDGNDVISNYGNSDRIKIVNGEMSGASVEGTDFILFVGNGSLTIQDSINKQIKLVDDYERITYINPIEYIESSINEGVIRGTETNDSLNNGNNPGDYNFGNNATIDALGGNDKIVNKGSNVYINAGTGSDTINNNGSDTTIIGAAGNDSIRTKGNQVIVDGGDGNDYMYNYLKSDDVTLTGGAGKDTIYNYGAEALVNAGDDDDYILNGNKGTASALNGGAGDDKIRNAGASDVLITGGAGDDSLISSNGKNVTINGGAGDDTVRISTGYNLIQYGEGDGYDIVYGYKNTDTIQITSGTITERWRSGADLIFVVNDGYIRLKNVRNRTITIVDTDGEVTYERFELQVPEGVTVTNSTDTSFAVDPPFEGTLDLNSFRYAKDVDASQSDCSITVIGNSKANVFKAGSGGGTLDGGKGNDILYCNSGADMMIYSKGDGNDVIYNYESGQDAIQLSSDVTVSKVTVRGKDVFLYFDGGGSIKVRDATGKALTIDENGSVGTYTFTKSTTNGLIADADGTVAAAVGDNTTPENAYAEKFWFNEDNLLDNGSLDSILNLSANTAKDNPNNELSLDILYNSASSSNMINGCSASIGSFSDT